MGSPQLSSFTVFIIDLNSALGVPCMGKTLGGTE